MFVGVNEKDLLSSIAEHPTRTCKKAPTAMRRRSLATVLVFSHPRAQVSGGEVAGGHSP